MWLQLGEQILEVQVKGSTHGGCHFIKQTWYKCLLSPFGGVLFHMNQ
jgi:hypothetical protein